MLRKGFFLFCFPEHDLELTSYDLFWCCRKNFSGKWIFWCRDLIIRLQLIRSNSLLTRLGHCQIILHKKGTTLEGLIAEDTFPERTFSESCNPETDDYRDENGSMAGLSGKCNSQVDSHIDVTEDDGFIIIPYSMISCLLLIVYLIQLHVKLFRNGGVNCYSGSFVFSIYYLSIKLKFTIHWVKKL